jgi:hypothetical protein
MENTGTPRSEAMRAMDAEVARLAALTPAELLAEMDDVMAGLEAGQADAALAAADRKAQRTA